MRSGWNPSFLSQFEVYRPFAHKTTSNQGGLYSTIEHCVIVSSAIVDEIVSSTSIYRHEAELQLIKYRNYRRIIEKIQATFLQNTAGCEIMKNY